MPSIESTSASEAENIGRYERDRLLLKQYVATRSDVAFATLFHRYHAFVYRTCLREVRDPELAADAAQIVFIALAHKACAIQRGSALSAWLFQAARFAARDLARKERCRMAQATVPHARLYTAHDTRPRQHDCSKRTRMLQSNTYRFGPGAAVVVRISSSCGLQTLNTWGPYLIAPASSLEPDWRACRFPAA